MLGSLLSRDTFQLYRPRPGVDEEGTEVYGLRLIGSFRGTWGSASSLDLDRLGRSGQQVDAVIAGNFPAQVDDVIRGLRGSDWTVVRKHDTVLHTRFFIRRVKS